MTGEPLLDILLVIRHTCDNPDNKVSGTDNCQVYNCPILELIRES
jgi:hypothetical protein